MSREKETIHLTPTSRGWASKGGKGLGFQKSKSMMKKPPPQDNRKQAPPKEEPKKPGDDIGKKPPVKMLSFEAWMIPNKQFYKSTKEAQAAYEKYVDGFKQAPKRDEDEKAVKKKNP